jgi:hypothetical protein
MEMLGGGCLRAAQWVWANAAEQLWYGQFPGMEFQKASACFGYKREVGASDFMYDRDTLTLQ